MTNGRCHCCYGIAAPKDFVMQLGIEKTIEIIQRYVTLIEKDVGIIIKNTENRWGWFFFTNPEPILNIEV